MSEQMNTLYFPGGGEIGFSCVGCGEFAGGGGGAARVSGITVMSSSITVDDLVRIGMSFVRRSVGAQNVGKMIGGGGKNQLTDDKMVTRESIVFDSCGRPLE